MFRRHPKPKGSSREIVRGITINHIQSARVVRKLEDTMKHLDAQNSKTQRLVVVTLAYVAIAVGFLQLIVGIVPLFW